MNISIIIPTLNAQQTIIQLVNSLNKQELAPYEILILDSSSKDKTVEIAASMGCTTEVIKKSNFNHGGTRNLGVTMTSGDVIVFMTQDAVPINSTFLTNLVKPLKIPDIAASFGRQLAKPDAIPPEKFTRGFNYPSYSIIKGKDDISKLGIKTFFFSDVCSAVRRKEFEEVGCFLDNVIMNEDMLLAATLILHGYKVAYAADAEVLHSHNYSAKQQFKRNFDIGVSLSMNSWLLKYAKAEGEGLKLVKEQFKYLVKNREYKWIPYTFGLNIAKYSGYKLGMLHDKLPVELRKKFSMHSFFWDEREEESYLNSFNYNNGSNI